LEGDVALKEHYGPYRGYWHAASGSSGIWYAEYCGWPAVRQFLVTEDGNVAVSPFDLAFLDRRTPTEAPTLPDGAAEIVTRADFEEAWARWAQPRLRWWSHETPDLTPATADLHYFLVSFPAALKINEPGSLLYYEYADLYRRLFEVWEDGTVGVAPYSFGIPEGGAEEMIHVAGKGVHLDGTPLPSDVEVREISHATFEQEWERLALPHLLTAAGVTLVKMVEEDEKGGEA
jgi:hypothetical protein